MIRACVAAFPSIWVRWTAYHELPLTERRRLSILSVCAFWSILHALISIITIATLECSLCVLTWSSLYALQEVSAPHLVALLSCPDKSLPLLSPGSEPRSVGFIPCPDNFLPPLSSGSEYTVHLDQLVF